jgi:hypothetical protein
MIFINKASILFGNPLTLTCESSCPSGYFKNLTNRQCDLCNSNCSTCDSSSIFCLSNLQK